ncbi:hypothetical protein J6590_026329 [Homalodisca vitripennis]|nr:hypothetical protein J6590_026329 [Homalodisca vitripennis]
MDGRDRRLRMKRRKRMCKWTLTSLGDGVFVRVTISASKNVVIHLMHEAGVSIVIKLTLTKKFSSRRVSSSWSLLETPGRVWTTGPAGNGRNRLAPCGYTIPIMSTECAFSHWPWLHNDDQAVHSECIIH